METLMVLMLVWTLFTNGFIEENTTTVSANTCEEVRRQAQKLATVDVGGDAGVPLPIVDNRREVVVTCIPVKQ